MKQFFTFIVAIFAAVLIYCLTGCSAVPSNRINISTPRGDYSVRAPKNVDISNFKAEVASDGTMSVEFEHWSSTNDANVIDKASAGRVAEINALRDLAREAFNTGVSAASALK